MTCSHPKLFEPIKIGKLEIKNRIAMAPMGIIGLVTKDGGFTQRAVNYYVERARGGAGLIITGAVKAENEIEKFHMPILPCITFNPRHFIQTASEMTEAVHAYGSKIIIQITAGFGRSASSQMVDGRPVAPSAIPNYWHPAEICRELTTEEVERLVAKFGEAAEIAATAGFDGIEVHAVHEGYLLDQFVISFFNKRTDKYGGDLEGRLRFPIEIVQAIKRRVGADYPVLIRFSIKSYVKDWRQGGLPGEEFAEKGRDTEEGLIVARKLEDAGYDGFDADAGTYDAWYWAHPPAYLEHGCYLSLTEKLKKVVEVPVIVAGRLEIPGLAEKALVEGKADIVALGRGLLADPYWPNKVREGRTEEIRPCLGCHDGCLGRTFLGRPLSCAVNPACGREREYDIQMSRLSKYVMVVGGGVAGMEAARVCALRGHRVELYEKSHRLGGHLLEASIPDFKKDGERLVEWYKMQLEKLNVCISLRQDVSSSFVKGKNPDAVIVATGSTPLIPNVLGIDSEKVATAAEILLGHKRVGDTVAIVGGGLVGCEMALWLAKQGKKITIVEMLDDLMKAGIPVPRPNRIMLLDLLRFYKVNALTETSLLEVTGDGILVINKSFCNTVIPADTIIVATGLKPDQELYQSLLDKIPNVYLIGDAGKAQNIMYAVWDAYEVARGI